MRLALLRGSLRSGPGSTGRRVGLIVGALLGIPLSLVAFGVLTVSRGHGPLPEDLSVLVFSALLVGWVVLPILTFGSDDLLDPSRLALLPLTGPQLLTVMGTGALIGVAPVATTVAALWLLPATGTSPSSYVVALLAVVLLLALCVTASRASAAALSGLLRSRRGRDLGVAAAALAGLSFQLINPLLQLAGPPGEGPGDSAFHGYAGPLRWTPPGLLATAPSRSLPAAIASLIVGAAVVAALLLLWERSIRRSLERAEISGSRQRRSTGLAPRGVPVPGGRVGAIMAKDLRYLVREPRRLVAALTGVLLPVVVVLGPVALSGEHHSRALVFVVCGVALLSGFRGGNRFGMDGSATWLLLSSATDRRDAGRDLLGGDLATAAVTIPVLLIVAGLLAAVTDGWGYVAPALGIALALFGVGVALSGRIAVRAAFAVPPSQNAFGAGGTGQGCTASLVTFVSLLADLALCLPLLGLLLPALLIPSTACRLALLVVGPGYGLVVGGLVRRAAARDWTERAPEVLHVLASARS